MDNIHDSEDYWSGSTRKAFSFDDDLSDFNTAALQTEPDGDVISEASFESTTPGAAINLSIKNVISEEALSIILQEQCLDERIIPKGVTPEEELKILRRQIQTTLYSPAPTATALKLLQGKNPPLEVFKSLNEKEELLDAVLLNGGGDATVRVLVFLKDTLNREHFYQILKQRPKALQHYVSFLKSCEGCEREAIEVLQYFGLHQEAALMQFALAMACENLTLRKRKLTEVIEKYGNAGFNIIGIYQQIFSNTLKLIDFVEKQRNALDNMVDLNSTPIEVLYACCHKYSNWKDQDVARVNSPYRLSTEQQISPAQFEWTALNERTTSQAFADLECIFERVPTWNPMKQKQFHISFSLEAAILRLHALKAPNTVLYLFLSKMSNNQEKLELARRVQSTKAVIDALAGLKDVHQLAQLMETLPERSEEKFYCDKALKNLQTKRWSTDNIKIKL